MRYYLCETIPETRQKYRAGKMRDDVEETLKTLGFGDITVTAAPEVGFGAYRKFRGCFDDLWKGDTLIVQTPFMTSGIIMRRLFKSLMKRGVEIYVVIHDLNDFLENCMGLCSACDGVLVNNEKVAAELKRQKLSIGKIVSFDLYDYYIPEGISGSCGEFSQKGPVVIAGTLSREEAGYIYHLPDNCDFRLYGNGYEGKVTHSIAFGGEYLPNDLPFMLKGSFGLVWTGTSPMTCMGLAGDVIKTYNPMQLSLYLSSGLPVIVWSESAAADFVIQKGCGFTVSSLAEIGYRLNSMSEKTYNKMKKSAEGVGIPMRDGCYGRSAFMKICESFRFFC